MKDGSLLYECLLIFAWLWKQKRESSCRKEWEMFFVGLYNSKVLFYFIAKQSRERWSKQPELEPAELAEIKSKAGIVSYRVQLLLCSQLWRGRSFLPYLRKKRGQIDSWLHFDYKPIE